MQNTNANVSGIKILNIIKLCLSVCYNSTLFKAIYFRFFASKIKNQCEKKVSLTIPNQNGFDFMVFKEL